MIESYPLYWPEGRRRTPAGGRRRSTFQANFVKCRDDLIRQIQLLGGKKPIISTNIPVRMDGLPYANTAQPNDPGVAVYFDYKGKSMCFPCDGFQKVHENIRAIGLTISALRSIQRYGSLDMMESAFRGFTAIPEKAGQYWRDVFEIPQDAKPTMDDVDKAFKMMALLYHPDKGGTMDEWQRIVTARENARQDLEAPR